MSWAFWRPAQAKEPDRDPNIPCKYCRSPFKWRMHMYKHVIYTCGVHVDKALDEYLEVRDGQVPANRG